MKESTSSRAATIISNDPVSYNEIESLSKKEQEVRYTLAFAGSLNGLYGFPHLRRMTVATEKNSKQDFLMMRFIDKIPDRLILVAA